MVIESGTRPRRGQAAEPTENDEGGAASSANPSGAALGASDRFLSLGLGAIRTGPLLIVVVLGVVFTIVNPIFISSGNLLNLAVDLTPILIIGFGQLIVIITRGVDLSVGAACGFASLIGWFAWNDLHLTGIAVIAVILAAGTLCGLINGIVIVTFRIANPFIVTLGAMYVLSGIGLLMTKGTPKQGEASLIVSLGSGQLGLPFGWYLPTPVIIAVLTTALVGVFLTTSRWGRWIFSVGGSPEGALRAGIPVQGVQISAYAISGLMAGLGAVVLSGRVAGGDANLANGYELLTIAAVIIGGGSFFGGRGNVWNVVAGALIVVGISNGLNLSSLDTNWLNIVIGLVLVAALGLDVLRRSAESSMRKRRARRAEGL